MFSDNAEYLPLSMINFVDDIFVLKRAFALFFLDLLKDFPDIEVPSSAHFAVLGGHLFLHAIIQAVNLEISI